MKSALAIVYVLANEPSTMLTAVLSVSHADNHNDVVS